MSQNAEILSYLARGHTLTPLEALSRFGCFRLAARVYELRYMGYDIQAETVEWPSKNGTAAVARYRLAPDKPLRRHSHA